MGVASLCYLPNASSGVGELIAVSRDHNLSSYTVGQFEEALRPIRTTDEDASETVIEKVLLPSRLLIGSHGDVLELTIIPTRECRSDDTVVGSSGVGGSSAKGQVEMKAKGFEMVVTTNSSQVRIMDENMSCSVLEGHTDIVLAASVSPDG